MGTPTAAAGPVSSAKRLAAGEESCDKVTQGLFPAPSGRGCF